MGQNLRSETINKVGIIQGRLSARPYPKLQEFPCGSWEQEFYHAKKIGYDFIEWIFEEKQYKDNPIWTANGRKQVRKHIMETQVPVLSVCADYFLEKPFFRRKGYSLEQNISILKELIKKTKEIGGDVILLPVLEKAEIRCKEDEETLKEAICAVIPTLEEYEVKLGLETELRIDKYFELVSQFCSNYIGAYYDAGNCAFCGHDMKYDMEILSEHVISIHVKDRKKKGKSVFLGTGDTNFAEGIPYLMKNGYKGNFVMQTYFEDNYLDEAENNLKYIKKLMGC